MDVSEALYIGCVGGIAVEVLALVKLKFLHPKDRKYLEEWFYWAVTVGTIVIGGFLTMVYKLDGINLSYTLAMNIGATAPLIIGGWFKDKMEISE